MLKIEQMPYESSWTDEGRYTCGCCTCCGCSCTKTYEVKCNGCGKAQQSGQMVRVALVSVVRTSSWNWDACLEEQYGDEADATNGAYCMGCWGNMTKGEKK